MDPQVAVVVVSYNTKELLLECIASVFESTTSRTVELVIVDNASEDGSYEAVRKAYPGAATIQNERNLGFGAASNQGIHATNSKFILLLNSDARLTAQAFNLCADCRSRMNDALLPAAGWSMTRVLGSTPETFSPVESGARARGNQDRIWSTAENSPAKAGS
jgi:GT2 family glycosyltransferase